jgi:hypothetical protein
MKRPNVITELLLALILISSSAYAQALNGTYGGQADGVDVNGQQLHQITRWTFNSGRLTAFKEIISFSQSFGGLACEFDAINAHGNLPYALGTLTDVHFVTEDFGCPEGSRNDRLESIVIMRENGAKEFSYLEYTASGLGNDDPAAHFSGHATTQAALP